MKSSRHSLRRPKRMLVCAVRTVATLLLSFAVGQSALGQISAELDKLDVSDSIQMPPEHVVCVDLLAIPGPTGWNGTGIRAITFNGAKFVYATDPNSGEVTGIAPGPENRFVTFFSEPRPRDTDLRYLYDSAPIIGGSYCTGVLPRFENAALDVAAGRFPPTPAGSGWVLRVALDLSEVTDPRFRTDSDSIVVAYEQPPNSIVLLDSYCGGEDLNRGTTIGDGATSTYFDWGIYGIIPEPGTSLLLVVVLVGLRVAGHRAC